MRQWVNRAEAGIVDPLTCQVDLNFFPVNMCVRLPWIEIDRDKMPRFRYATMLRDTFVSVWPKYPKARHG